MNGAENISFLVAFAAGIASFLSPCILPLIPSYLSYLTGLSFKELSDESSKDVKKEIALKTFLHSLFFVGGFTAVFVLLGATATLIGQFFLEYQGVLKKLSGLLIYEKKHYIPGIFFCGVCVCCRVDAVRWADSRLDTRVCLRQRGT